jgi:hypothetical protein
MATPTNRSGIVLFFLPLVLALAQGCAGATREASPSAMPGVAQPGYGSLTPHAAAAGAVQRVAMQDGQVATDERKIIRDASLTIEVPKAAQIPAALRAARQLTARYGGYVSSETSQSVVVKVPAPRFDEMLSATGALGEITKRDVTARDVTSEHVDLAIRITNARRLQERLRELVGQTQDMARILEIERELARVTVELESYEGQMRLMENQTSYATITLSFEERVSPGPLGWVFVGMYKGVKWLFVWD